MRRSVWSVAKIGPASRLRASPVEMAASIWRHRDLLWQMTRREVVGRYRGSVMGLAWSFFNPVLMLAVYTFVFSVVFKARWGENEGGSHAGFAIVVFVGMIVHGLFAECVNRAPGLILSNANFVKKVVFPLEILPVVALGSALFHALISLLVLVLAFVVLSMDMSWTAVIFPLVLAPLLLVTLGFAWFLSATGVFVRDIAHITGVFTAVLLFLSPVFYPMSALPETYQNVMLANPLTFIIEQARRVLIGGQLPDWLGLGVYFIGSALVAWAGFWWFQRTRRGFADVL